MSKKNGRRKRGPARDRSASTATFNTDLVQQAAESVPLGSGIRVFGEGGCCYMKVNRHDGSMTVYCFRTQAEVEAAMATGIAADIPIGERAQA